MVLQECERVVQGSGVRGFVWALGGLCQCFRIYGFRYSDRRIRIAILSGVRALRLRLPLQN